MAPDTDLAKLAYCGLYCGACPLFLATEAGTLGELAHHRAGAEGLRCLGCRTGTVSVYCLNCSMKKCARGQGLESCAACADFPCRVLRAFDGDDLPHHHGVIDALRTCRELGAARWLEAQASRNTCRGCGRRLTYHERSCPGCGQERGPAAAG